MSVCLFRRGQGEARLGVLRGPISPPRSRPLCRFWGDRRQEKEDEYRAGFISLDVRLGGWETGVKACQEHGRRRQGGSHRQAVEEPKDKDLLSSVLARMGTDRVRRRIGSGGGNVVGVEMTDGAACEARPGILLPASTRGSVRNANGRGRGCNIVWGGGQDPLALWAGIWQTRSPPFHHAARVWRT